MEDLDLVVLMVNRDNLELLVARVMSVTLVSLVLLVVWVRLVIRVNLDPEELMVMLACLDWKVYQDWMVGREWPAIQALQVPRDRLAMNLRLDCLD